jgi:hypothetical protein
MTTTKAKKTSETFCRRPQLNIMDKTPRYGPYEAAGNTYFIDKETEEDWCVWSSNGYCVAFNTKEEAVSHIEKIRSKGQLEAFKEDVGD